MVCWVARIWPAATPARWSRHDFAVALATALAGIHHGITNEIARPPAFEGNAGFAFDAALARLVESEVLAEYLGPEYPRLYAACETEELDAFERHIGTRGYAWYLQPERGRNSRGRRSGQCAFHY